MPVMMGMPTITYVNACAPSLVEDLELAIFTVTNPASPAGVIHRSELLVLKSAGDCLVLNMQRSEVMF
jgi:hypothetical protein